MNEPNHGGQCSTLIMDRGGKVVQGATIARDNAIVGVGVTAVYVH